MTASAGVPLWAVVPAYNEEVRIGLRRLRAWGVRRTLLWCWDRRYRPADVTEVHVR